VQNPKVYLSGAIDGRTLERANTWRKEAEKLLYLRGWIGLNPLRGKEYQFSPDEIITSKGYQDYSSADSVIVTRDLMDIQASNALLVYVGYQPNEEEVKPLTGTVCEVFAARHSFFPPKPCIAFKNEGDGVHPQTESPWFGQFFTPRYRVLPSLGDAVDFLVSFF